MAVIGVAIRALALFIMYMISNPKIMPLSPPLTQEEKAKYHILKTSQQIKL